MNTRKVSTLQTQLANELQELPQEYLPNLIQLIRLYRESIMLQPAGQSFKKGWNESMKKQTHPLHELWDGIISE